MIRSDMAPQSLFLRSFWVICGSFLRHFFLDP